MSTNILLTSSSILKSEAVTQFFETKLNKKINLVSINCTECKLPEQPIIDDNTEGFYFSKERMNFARKTNNFDDYDYVVSIESGIAAGMKEIEDVCYVLIYHKGLLSKGQSFAIPMDFKYLKMLEDTSKMIEYNTKIYGYGITAGKLMAKENHEIDSKNWMIKTAGIDRREQIKWAIKEAFNKMIKMVEGKAKLMEAYKSYQDYPKEGILFHDMFPLMKNPVHLNQLVKLISNHYKYDVIDYVVGLEARGFCIGPLLAYKLGCGFVPIRKEGKLPGKTIKYSYDKEYGKDTCEIQCDDLEGSRVLVVDDLIATGGSIKAAIDLLEMLKCIVVDCCVLRDVPTLKDQYIGMLGNHKCTILMQ